MRKPRSSFLAMAALIWLLPLWISPAWSYYPPLLASATFGAQSVTRQAYDPKLQRNVLFTTYYLFGDEEVVSLQEQYGVIAWVHRSGANYYVTCCTYDPVLNTAIPSSQNPFQQDTRGPFTSVDQLQVADGVVAYVAGIPPSGGDPTGHFEFKYATYDPAKPGWQMRSWSYGQISAMSLATKDGVVIFLFTDYLGNRWLWADIYDPGQGMWGFGGAQGVNLPKGIWGLTIGNATVSYVTPELSDTWGYTAGVGWHAGTFTPPQAYFVARPTSGPAPLWVWFTDMSIGASNQTWNFGDGNSSLERSPSHTYSTKGTYGASQSVNAGAAHYDRTITVSGAGIAPLLNLLLNN
jgi:hypothetical protein